MTSTLPQPVRDDIKPAILALNNAHAVELSWMDATQLETLLQIAFHARQIGDGDAFLLAFDQQAAYESPNFRWFRQRYKQFVYIDRVVVSPLTRGHGYARALYTDLFANARYRGQTLVVCEVNSDPPNPGSDAFHSAMQFTEVGRDTIHRGSKTVRYLARVRERMLTCADVTNCFHQPVWFRQERLGPNCVSVMAIAGSEDYVDTGAMLHNPRQDAQAR